MVVGHPSEDQVQGVFAEGGKGQDGFKPISDSSLKTALVLHFSSQKDARFVGQLAASVAHLHLDNITAFGASYCGHIIHFWGNVIAKLYLAAVGEAI